MNNTNMVIRMKKKKNIERTSVVKYAVKKTGYL